MMDTATAKGATMRNDLPRPRSVRFSDEDIDLLARLQRRLGRTQREILSLALRHLWMTLERDERVHLEIPERPEEE